MYRIYMYKNIVKVLNLQAKTQLLCVQIEGIDRYICEAKWPLQVFPFLCIKSMLQHKDPGQIIPLADNWDFLIYRSFLWVKLKSIHQPQITIFIGVIKHSQMGGKNGIVLPCLTPTGTVEPNGWEWLRNSEFLEVLFRMLQVFQNCDIYSCPTEISCFDSDK